MLLIRRVVGESMFPGLRPGQLVLVSRLFRRLQTGHIIIIRHNGLEKIKRISHVDGGHVFVLGDNTRHSTDSRDFGRLPKSAIIGKVIWPSR